MLIIGLGHKKGVGKDTLGQFLNTELRMRYRNLDVKAVGFADPLKEIAYKLYAWAGVKNKDYYNTHREERDVILPTIGMSVRQLWIELGMKLREIYADTWLEYTLNIKADVLIIMDLRFPNEAFRIDAMNGLLVKVENNRVLPTNDKADCALDEHNLIWNHFVQNNGTKHDLYKQAGQLIDSISGSLAHGK